MIPILHLPNQPSLMRGTAAVTWTRLVFRKVDSAMPSPYAWNEPKPCALGKLGIAIEPSLKKGVFVDGTIDDCGDEEERRNYGNG